MRSRFMFTGAVLLIATAVPVLAADDRVKSNTPGAVELSNGTKVAQNPALPKLNLTNNQREQIRKGVLTEHTEVEFRLKATKGAKNFTPAVGAKLPKGVKGYSLPSAVLSQLPQLRDYTYVKMKDQVLIVDAMTGKIVDVFSETLPIT
jgi:hypothetical protein